MMPKFLPFLLFLLFWKAVYSETTAGRSDWHDIAEAGLKLPHKSLWQKIQFRNIVDFLLPKHIASYTSFGDSVKRVTFPSGEWMQLSLLETNALSYYVTIQVTRMSDNAIIPNFKPSNLLLFVQAYPYAGKHDYSVIKTGFRLSSGSSSQKTQTTNVLRASVRSWHDTIRQSLGAYPCMEHYRTYGGTCNNLENPSWGAYRSALRRLDNGVMDPTFKPGTNDYSKHLPNARTISRKIFQQTISKPSRRRVSMLAVFWGQFIDHDIDLTPESAHTVGEEHMDIEVEDSSDPMYKRHNAKLEFTRSMGMKDGRPCCGNGIAERSPRDQVNAVSGFIDGSQVYGCERNRVASLRKGNHGELHMTESADGPDMLPKNDVAKLGIKLENAPSDSEHMYVAGDIRVNEQPVLASLHTIFAREHNRLAKTLRTTLKCRSEERVFQYCRKIVAAQIQYITYNFFLPALLGKKYGLDKYQGYKPNVDPSISNFFSTCAFRFGHSMVSDTLKILEKRSKSHPKDGILLHETFFDPSLLDEVGVEPLLLGASRQVAEAVDTEVVNSLQNELFKETTGGIDLVARNIQRGRDHGIPGYNDARHLHGLNRVSSFKEVTSDESVRKKLEEVYKSVDNIDPFVGGLAEDPLEDSELGQLFSRAIRDQFKRLRDGDRFFYRNIKWPEDIASLEEVKEITSGRLSLQSIIIRNSGDRLAKEDFPKNVFIGVS